MDNQKSSNTSSGEMDLSNLFSRLGAFISNAFSTFLKGLANIRRTTLENRSLFFVLIILGIAAGYIYGDYIRKKYYESSMILSSDYLNKRIVENSIQKLNLLLAGASKEGIKQALQINDSLANNIIGFEARTFIGEDEIIELRILKEQLKNSKLEVENPKIIDEVIKKIEIENQHAFEIKVKLYNPKEFSELENALVNYFKNNEYVKKRIEINRKNLLVKQLKLKRDFERLDSLKSVIYDNFKRLADDDSKSTNGVLIGDMAVTTNPVEVYIQDLKMYTEFQETNEKVYLESDFEVVDGFTELNVPSNQTLPVVVIQFLFGALLIGYLIIGFKKFNKFLDSLA